MAPSKVVVVGAGPVGALAAIYAASRGDDVEVYELRSDLRDPSTTPLNFTKSINLALSERGIYSLSLAKRPGLLESILNESIPMHGRMIHGMKNGELYAKSQAYDVHGRSIRAADRGGLNKSLLNELEQMPNVKMFFNHKLTGADFKKRRAWFEQQGISGAEIKRAAEVEKSFDFLIGADGAHSAVRFHLMKYARISYQQEYIDTLWCEFHIPSANTSDQDQEEGFRISPHHLHIWPGTSCMFIAIPSRDKSFTCTLFLSASQFASLDADPDTVVPYFEKTFPGVVSTLISPSDLRQQYLDNPHLPLISIKCNPYHYSSSVVILGDAAHAMVPFYGQGMNAGLEDVRVLFGILDKHVLHGPVATDSERKNQERQIALNEYTKQRKPDAYAINDLALRNYQEMRSDVRSPLYLLRKRMEELFSLYLPSLGIATQYSRVSFGTARYSDVEKSVQRQGKYFLGLLSLFTAASVGSTLWLALRRNRSSQLSRLLAEAPTAIQGAARNLGQRSG